MGSPWNKRRTEDDEHGIDRLGAPPTKPGLGAAELDLLRQAPDYDAEEMASVRLSGGWPAPLAQPGRSLAPAEAAAKPAAPSWLPPNRLERDCTNASVYWGLFARKIIRPSSHKFALRD